MHASGRYAEFLMQLGVLPEGAAYEETDGARLANDGPGQPGTPASANAPARPGTGLMKILEAMQEARALPRPASFSRQRLHKT